jgi:Metallo-peptidase family M12/Calx-beta domain
MEGSTLRALASLTLVCLAGACGSGGGGGGPAVSFSFGSAASGIDEDGGTRTLPVVLHAPPGGLTAQASVRVSDAGSGSATSGADYTPFANVVLTFPVGAQDGDQKTVQVEVLADHSVEGADETVVLELEAPQSASIASPSTHTLTVRDVDEATLRFQTPASATPDEQSQEHTLVVELALPPGVTLGVEVRARLADTGAGSATSGSDYATFAPRWIQFAAGSADGALSSAALEVQDDALTEADETVQLGLSQPSPGAHLGGSAHVLTILDDDAGGDPFLAVTEGPTGVENVLEHDDPLALGSQSVGAGPNAGTLVRLANQGGGQLNLAAPELSGSHPNDFAVEIESLSTPLAAQASEAPIPRTDALAPFSELRVEPGRGLSLAFDAARAHELAALTSVTLHDFPLPGRPPVTLALHRLPLPFTPDAVLAVNGEPQPGGLRAALEGLTVWRGTVLEEPESRVFLALSPTGTRGFVELPNTPDRLVHVFSEASDDPLAAPRVRLALEGQLAALGVEPPPEICGGAVELAGMPPPPMRSPSGPGTSALTAADCRLAIETDWQLYQKFSSSAATAEYVTELVAAVSDRYLTDVQATLSIAYLGIWSTPADPWSSQDGGGDASDLLDEFRTAWNASGWPAPADLAHFISGAGLGGGVAYLNVLCNSSFGYGVSGNINGNINWGTWTGQPGSFTWDFVVVAHELGHNFGANHTHAYCPPLDQCSTNCNGTTVCSQGTLMSYCHLCAGGMNNILLEFHPVVADIMRGAINASCLGESALAGGDWVQYLVRFNPQGPTGARNADLLFVHGASNAPSPFRLKLSGTATN